MFSGFITPNKIALPNFYNKTFIFFSPLIRTMANIKIKTRPDSNKQAVELTIYGDNTIIPKAPEHKVKNPRLLQSLYNYIADPDFNKSKQITLRFNPIQQTGVGTAIILHNYEGDYEDNILLASQRDAKAPHHPFWFNIPSGGIQGGEQAIIDAARNSGPDGIDKIIRKNMINEFAGEMVMLVPKRDSTYNIIVPDIFDKPAQEQYINKIAERTEKYQIKYPIMGEIYNLIKNNKFEEVETFFDNKWNPDEITINVKYKDNGKEQTCTLKYPNTNFGWTVGKDCILYSCIFFAYEIETPIDAYYMDDVITSVYGKEIFPIDLEGLDNGSLWFQRNSALITLNIADNPAYIIKPPPANETSLEKVFKDKYTYFDRYEKPLLDENILRILARYKKDPVKAYFEMRIATEEKSNKMNK